MMQQEVFPTLTALMPWLLSRAIRWQARRGVMQLGSTKTEHRCLVVRTREWQRAVPKEVHNLLQAKASSPNGPAAPFVLRAIDHTMDVSTELKMTGRTSMGMPWWADSGENSWGVCSSGPLWPWLLWNQWKLFDPWLISQLSSLWTRGGVLLKEHATGLTTRKNTNLLHMLDETEMEM